MTWSVVWEPAAERALLAIPSWQTATTVASAVQTFAKSGVGAVERVKTETSAPFRLRVPPYVVRFSLEPASRTLRVWSLWRSA